MSRNPKTANVPKVPAGLERSLAHFLNGVKESIEVSRGRAGDQESFVTKKYLEEKGYSTGTTSSDATSSKSLEGGGTSTRQSLGTHEVQTINIADRAVTEVKIAEGAVLTRLDVLDMISISGGTYLSVAVADITAPIELGNYSSVDGRLLIAYEVDANQDFYTIYAFDSADASGASSPYVVAGLSGFWIAVSGKYQKGDINITDNVNIGGALTLGAGLDEFTISESTDDITMKNTISDKDIILNVNDGGSDVEVARFVGADRSMKFHASLELNLQQCNASQALATDASKNVVSTTIADPFPVGSVFLSVVSTNPNTLLGYGTWSQISQGNMLVGFKTGDADFGTVEGAGGAKTHTHSITGDSGVPDDNTSDGSTVTITGSTGVKAPSTGAPSSWNTTENGTTGVTNEVALRAHTHTVDGHLHSNGTLAGSSHTHTMKNHKHSLTTGSAVADNGLPPYFTVYVWKRTV